MTMSRDVLDRLLSGVKNAGDLLGHEPDTGPSNQQRNCRNGTTHKTLKRVIQATGHGKAEKALADFEAEWGQKHPSKPHGPTLIYRVSDTPLVQIVIGFGFNHLNIAWRQAATMVS